MKPVTISVRVLRPDADASSLADLTSDLRETVLDSDVDDVRPATGGPVPPGAKSGALVAVGALVVTLVPTIVDNLVKVLSSWLMRQPSDVEIEVDGQRFRGSVTREQRDQLVEAFMRQVDRER